MERSSRAVRTKDPQAYRPQRLLPRWLIGLVVLGLALRLTIGGFDAVAAFGGLELSAPATEQLAPGEIAFVLPEKSRLSTTIV